MIQPWIVPTDGDCPVWPYRQELYPHNYPALVAEALGAELWHCAVYPVGDKWQHAAPDEFQRGYYAAMLPGVTLDAANAALAKLQRTPAEGA